MSQALENLLREDRMFAPSEEFAAQANAKPGIHAEAGADFEAFWHREALERITWYREPTQVLDGSNPPFFKWFSDGTLNLSFNCLDRHVEAGRGDRVAYHWVGEPPGETRDVTYRELLATTCRVANALRALGVSRGDRVGIYMGMVPECATTMLACARIGAPHVVVFGGFSSESLAERMRSAGVKVLVTQDEGWRKGAAVPLKASAHEAAG